MIKELRGLSNRAKVPILTYFDLLGMLACFHTSHFSSKYSVFMEVTQQNHTK
jgi:hypothetical protein